MLRGDSFGCPVNDPFELQDRVVDAVLCGVVGHITDAEFAHACGKDPNVTVRECHTCRPAAHPEHERGERTEGSVSILNRAIEQDFANASPAALLACCQAQLGNYYGTTSPTARRATAMQLACRAGMLDDSDPLVTLARGATATMSLQSHEADALVTLRAGVILHLRVGVERHGIIRPQSGGDPDWRHWWISLALKAADHHPSWQLLRRHRGCARRRRPLENAMLCSAGHWRKTRRPPDVHPGSCYALKAEIGREWWWGSACVSAQPAVLGSSDGPPILRPIRSGCRGDVSSATHVNVRLLDTG